MNKQEAYSIVSGVLQRYWDLGFSELRSRAGMVDSEEILGPSGTRYTVDVTIGWSDSRQRSLCVRARIDDQNTFHSEPMEESLRVTNGEDDSTQPNVG